MPWTREFSGRAAALGIACGFLCGCATSDLRRVAEQSERLADNVRAQLEKLKAHARALQV